MYLYKKKKANILFWWSTVAIQLSQTSLDNILHILTVYICSLVISNNNYTHTGHWISYAMQPLSV